MANKSLKIVRWLGSSACGGWWGKQSGGLPHHSPQYKERGHLAILEYLISRKKVTDSQQMWATGVGAMRNWGNDELVWYK